MLGGGLRLVGIIERGVPQAYVRARASSATLCSVHVLRVFLCIFLISKRESDTYQNGLGCISDTYPNPYPLSRYPPYDYSKGGNAECFSRAFRRKQACWMARAIALRAACQDAWIALLASSIGSWQVVTGTLSYPQDGLSTTSQCGQAFSGLSLWGPYFAESLLCFF